MTLSLRSLKKVVPSDIFQRKVADVETEGEDFIHPRLMVVVFRKQSVNRFPCADIGNHFVRIEFFAISGHNANDAIVVKEQRLHGDACSGLAASRRNRRQKALPNRGTAASNCLV